MDFEIYCTAVEVDAVLAGNVIQDYFFRDSIHLIEGFAESEVHVHLSFTLLKIYNACWHNVKQQTLLGE